MEEENTTKNSANDSTDNSINLTHNSINNPSINNPPTNSINKKRIVPWIIFLIFFAVLNETVFNVSLPKIAEQFSLTPSGVGWIMIIFLIFFGIGSTIYGRLSDMYSLKSLIILGIIIYSTGSILGFVFSNNYPLILLARAIQGAGASAIPALIFVVAARYIPEADRGKVFGLITSTVSLGIGLGPIVGGLVSGFIGWQYLFLIPLLMLISLPFLNSALPKESHRPGKVDVIGAILLALTIGAFVVFINLSVWYYLVAFLLLLAILIVQMRNVTDSFIQPSIFRNVKFRSGTILGFVVFSMVLGVIFIIPLMLHAVYGLDTKQIGFVLFPGAISSVIFGPIGGTLADRKGNKLVIIIGLGLLVISMIVMAVLMNLSVILIAGAMLLTYIGFALFQTAIFNTVSQSLNNEETGAGMGLFNLILVISGAVGIALLGKFLSSKISTYPLLPTVTADSYAYSNILLLLAVIVLLAGSFYIRSKSAQELKA